MIWYIVAIVGGFAAGYIVASWRHAGRVFHSTINEMAALKRADDADEEMVRLRAARDMDEWLRD